MALLVSSNDFIKTNESAIRDQIQASLDMMDSKQLEEFGKNVASLVDLVNESAQQALSRITTGYYTEEEKEKIIDLSKKTGKTLSEAIADSRKIHSNLAAYATQQDAKKAEDEAKLQAKKAEDEAKKEFELLIKPILSAIEADKKLLKDSKKFVDKLLSKIKSEIDELKKSRHSFEVEKMNRQLSSLQIDKQAIVSTIDNLIQLINDRINTLETVLPLVEQLKTNYSRYNDLLDKTSGKYNQLIKKIYKVGIDAEAKNKIDSDFISPHTSLLAEIIRLEESIEPYFQRLNDTLGNLMDIKRFTALAGPIDAPKPTKDKIDDIKGFVKFLEARNSDMKKLEAQFKLNKQDTKSKDIISSTGIRSETKLTSSGVDIPLNVPQFAAEGKPQELVPPATPTIAPLEVEGGPVTEQGPLAIRGNVNLGTTPSRQVEYARERPSQEDGGIELQPITRAQPPVEGEAEQAAAGPVVGEEVAVTLPAEEPAAAEPLESDVLTFRRIRNRLSELTGSPTDKEKNLQDFLKLNELKQELAPFVSQNDRFAIQLNNEIIQTMRDIKLMYDALNLSGKGRSSYRRRMKKKGRKTFRRHK